MIRGYANKTNTPWDDLRVEGHFRTRLVYRLLSEDLIETEGSFPGTAMSEDTIQHLCSRIESKTGAGQGLIEKTIRDFIGKGYIRARQMPDGWAWQWTHNNRSS